MDVVAEARKRLSGEFARSVREGDGWMVEADCGLNSASIGLVRAFDFLHGQAWLAKLNLDRDEVGRGDVPPEKVMWRYSGVLYTFGADYVFPRFDEELVRRIVARHNATYTSTRDDARVVNEIMAYAAEIGGVTLIWS